MLNGVPRILIIRLSAIGDVVRVLPALHTLRLAFPSAQIDWAVERKAAAVVEGNPALDQVHVFERGGRGEGSWRRYLDFWRTIRDGHYDMVFDFHGILKSGLLARGSRARDRYGFARPRAQEGSWLCVNHRLKLPGEVLTRVEENLRLVELHTPRAPHGDIAIAVPDEVQEDLDEFVDTHFDAGKWVVVMHAPVDRPEKQWPLEYFSELADLLNGDGRFEVLLTWGPGQRHIAEHVSAKARRPPTIGPEMPSLKHYAWLAFNADLYFGGDTGPMHIASAMGTPVVAVFGGTDPRRHAPMREPYTLLTAPGAGAAGSKHDGAERLRAITPEQAYDACVMIMQRLQERHEQEQEASLH